MRSNNIVSCGTPFSTKHLNVHKGMSEKKHSNQVKYFIQHFNFQQTNRYLCTHIFATTIYHDKQLLYLIFSISFKCMEQSRIYIKFKTILICFLCFFFSAHTTNIMRSILKSKVNNTF